MTNGRQIPVATIRSEAGGGASLDLLLAGAEGYLTRSTSADALVGTIKLIVAGRIFVPVNIMNASSKGARCRLLEKWERNVLTVLLAG